jgi:hypothetical protein
VVETSVPLSPDQWRALIDRALPKRELKVNRLALINAIVNDIKLWIDTAPEIKPHADKIRQIADIAGDLDSAIEKADAALLELGVDKEYDEAIAERIAIGIDRQKMSFGGASPAIDLHLILWRAADGLNRWKRLYGPRDGRPVTFAASLTKNLQYLLRHQVHCTADEFEEFLYVFNDGSGLPKLNSATLKQRQKRTKKKSRVQTTPAI